MPATTTKTFQQGLQAAAAQLERTAADLQEIADRTEKAARPGSLFYTGTLAEIQINREKATLLRGQAKIILGLE